jgi:hypothetical protein
MARPTKHNVTYFSHDVQMRNDVKIKALRRKYGHLGYSIWNITLEILGDAEYFEIEWNDMSIELLTPEYDCDSAELREVIDYCIKLNLLQIKNGYLYSEKFTQRLEETVLSRRTGYCSNNSKRNELKVVNDNNNLVNDNIYGQSKVKESKVNNSIVKESKEEESIVNEIKAEDSKVEEIDFDLASELSFFDNVVNR